jgi:hypothetical protein
MQPMPVVPPVDDDDLPPHVARWDAAGGTWRVATVGTDSATVELCRCDAGEVVEVLELAGTADLHWARQRLDAQDTDA